jgi:CSLREA domain-containing protein
VLQGRGWKALVALCALAVAALLVASHASAAILTFTVNSNGDQADPDVGDDICDVGGGVCTLRAAIQEANANSPEPGDTINFDPSVTGQIVLTGTLPVITDGLTINGPGADELAIDGDNTYRVLTAQSGTTTAISGLTIRGGQAPVTGGGTAANAGGIRSDGDMTLNRVVVTDNHASVTGAANVNVQASGAGIANGAGTLTLTRSTVAHNDANAVASGTGQASVNGGGIWTNAGTLHIDHSTINENQANATVSGGSGSSLAWPFGGGLYMYQASLTIDQSTINNNSATAMGATSPGAGNFASGGGLYQDNLSTLTATGTTVSGNSVGVPEAPNTAVQGANLELLSGGTFRDSIVADPVGADNCSGTFTSSGYNLEDDPGPSPSCGFTETTDIAGQNPMLAPLANNGGPTNTQALPANSPAIDQGKSFGATTDQRDAGFPRISDSPTIANATGGDGSDIGAFERDSVPPHNPLITASNPKSPANNNLPKLRGLAAAGSIVRIYKTAGCTGPAVKAGSASTFSSPGLAVTVANNTSTTFRATATDASNNKSTCSPGFTYVEDSKPPNTSITSTTLHPRYHSATFGFSSTEPGSTFRCKLDAQPYASCTSPRTYGGLAAGHHTFRVRATDKAGNVDATPASTGFNL